MQADDLRLLGIPRSRQTVASIYPQYSADSQGFPFHFLDTASNQGRVTHSLHQCSARAAQDIWEHHRPAVGSSMLALKAHTAPQRSVAQTSRGTSGKPLRL